MEIMEWIDTLRGYIVRVITAYIFFNIAYLGSLTNT